MFYLEPSLTGIFNYYLWIKSLLFHYFSFICRDLIQSGSATRSHQVRSHHQSSNAGKVKIGNQHLQKTDSRLEISPSGIIKLEASICGELLVWESSLPIYKCGIKDFLITSSFLWLMFWFLEDVIALSFNREQIHQLTAAFSFCFSIFAAVNDLFSDTH